MHSHIDSTPIKKYEKNPKLIIEHYKIVITIEVIIITNM